MGLLDLLEPTVADPSKEAPMHDVPQTARTPYIRQWED